MSADINALVDAVTEETNEILDIGGGLRISDRVNSSEIEYNMHKI